MDHDNNLEQKRPQRRPTPNQKKTDHTMPNYVYCSPYKCPSKAGVPGKPAGKQYTCISTGNQTPRLLLLELANFTLASLRTAASCQPPQLPDSTKVKYGPRARSHQAMSPRSAQQLAEQAVAAAAAGDFPAAAAGFAGALAGHEGDAALHEQHAQCLMELEQYEAAVKAARRATVLQPTVGSRQVRQTCTGLCHGRQLTASSACPLPFAVGRGLADPGKVLAERWRAAGRTSSLCPVSGASRAGP